MGQIFSDELEMTCQEAKKSKKKNKKKPNLST